MIRPELAEGQSYVEGRSEETARALYEAAEKAGVDQALVSTTSHGYVAPSEVVSAAGLEETKIELTAPNGINVHTDGTDAQKEAVAKRNAKQDAEFDPADHTVAEVQEHLASADDAERERVLAAEKDGKARKGLLEEEGDK